MDNNGFNWGDEFPEEGSQQNDISQKDETFTWGEEFPETFAESATPVSVDNSDDDSYWDQFKKGVEHAGSSMGDMVNSAVVGLDESIGLEGPISRYQQQKTKKGIQGTRELEKGLTTFGNVTSMGTQILPSMAAMIASRGAAAPYIAGGISGGMQYGDIISDQVYKGKAGEDGLIPLDQESAMLGATASAVLDGGLTKFATPLLGGRSAIKNIAGGATEGVISGAGTNTFYNAATGRDLTDNLATSAIGGGLAGGAVSGTIEGASKLFGAKSTPQSNKLIEDMVNTESTLGTSGDNNFRSSVVENVKMTETLDAQADAIYKDGSLGAREKEAALLAKAEKRAGLNTLDGGSNLSTQYVLQDIAEIEGGTTNRWQNATSADGKRFGDITGVSEKAGDVAGKRVANATEGTFFTIGNKKFTRDQYYDRTQKTLRDLVGQHEGVGKSRINKINSALRIAEDSGESPLRIKDLRRLRDDLSTLDKFTAEFSAPKSQDVLPSIRDRSADAIALARKLGLTESLRGYKGRAFDPETEAMSIKSLYAAAEKEIPGFREGTKHLENSDKKAYFDATDAALGFTTMGAGIAARKLTNGVRNSNSRKNLVKELEKGTKISADSLELAKLTEAVAKNARKQVAETDTNVTDVDLGEMAGTGDIDVTGDMAANGLDQQGIETTLDDIEISPTVTPTEVSPLPTRAPVQEVAVIPEPVIEPEVSVEMLPSNTPKVTEVVETVQEAPVDSVEVEVPDIVPEIREVLPSTTPKKAEPEVEVVEAPKDDGEVEIKREKLTARKPRKRASKEEVKADEPIVEDKAEAPEKAPEDSPEPKKSEKIPTSKPKSVKKAETSETTVPKEKLKVMKKRDRDIYESKALDDQSEKVANTSTMRRLESNEIKREALVKSAQDALLDEGKPFQKITDQAITEKVRSMVDEMTESATKKAVSTVLGKVTGDNAPHKMAMQALNDWNTERNISKAIRKEALEDLGLTAEDLTPAQVKTVRKKQRDLVRAATEAEETPKRVASVNKEYGIDENVYKTAIANLDINEKAMKSSDYKKILDEEAKIINKQQAEMSKKANEDMKAASASNVALIKKERQSLKAAQDANISYDEESARLAEIMELPVSERPKHLDSLKSRVLKLQRRAKSYEEAATKASKEAKENTDIISKAEQDISKSVSETVKADAILKTQSQLESQSQALRKDLEKLDTDGSYAHIIEDILDTQFTGRSKLHPEGLYAKAKAEFNKQVTKEAELSAAEGRSAGKQVEEDMADMNETEAKSYLRSISDALSDLVKIGNRSEVARVQEIKAAATKNALGKVEAEVAKGESTVDKLFAESYERKLKYPDHPELWIAAESKDELQRALGKNADSTSMGRHHKNLRMMINNSDADGVYLVRDEIKRRAKKLDEDGIIAENKANAIEKFNKQLAKETSGEIVAKPKPVKKRRKGSLGSIIPSVTKAPTSKGAVLDAMNRILVKSDTSVSVKGNKGIVPTPEQVVSFQKAKLAKKEMEGIEDIIKKHDEKRLADKKLATSEPKARGDYDHITKEAKAPHPSWSRAKQLDFEYFNPNGLVQEANEVSNRISQQVDEGKLMSGHLLTTSRGYASDAVRELYKKRKSLGKYDLSVYQEMTKEKIKKDKELADSVDAGTYDGPGSLLPSKKALSEAPTKAVLSDEDLGKISAIEERVSPRKGALSGEPGVKTQQEVEAQKGKVSERETRIMEKVELGEDLTKGEQIMARRLGLDIDYLEDM